jgi:hypothetical protein
VVRTPSVLLLLLVACGGPASGAPGVFDAERSCAAPPVDLAFAWPAEVRAQVMGLDVTESRNADGTAPLRGESPSRLVFEVEPLGDRRRVSFRADGPSRTRTRGFAPEIVGLRPRVILGPEGAVEGLEGLDAMRARFQAWVEAGRIPEAERRALAPALTDDAQLDSARSHWNWITAVWHGQHLECGRLRRGRASVPGLALGATTMEVDYTLAYLGPARCGDREADDCISLRVTQEAGSEEVARGLALFGDADHRVLGGRVLRIFDLLVEPSTLLPHRVSVVEHQTLEWSGVEGNLTREIADRQEYVFRYRDPSRRGRIVILPDGSLALSRGGALAELPDAPACEALARCCADPELRDQAAHLVCLDAMERATDPAACAAGATSVRQRLLEIGRALPVACGGAPPVEL